MRRIFAKQLFTIFVEGRLRWELFVAQRRSNIAIRRFVCNQEAALGELQRRMFSLTGDAELIRGYEVHGLDRRSKQLFGSARARVDRTCEELRETLESILECSLLCYFFALVEFSSMASKASRQMVSAVTEALILELHLVGCQSATECVGRSIRISRGREFSIMHDRAFHRVLNLAMERRIVIVA